MVAWDLQIHSKTFNVNNNNLTLMFSWFKINSVDDNTFGCQLITIFLLNLIVEVKADIYDVLSDCLPTCQRYTWKMQDFQIFHPKENNIYSMLMSAKIII